MLSRPSNLVVDPRTVGGSPSHLAASRDQQDRGLWVSLVSTRIKPEVLGYLGITRVAEVHHERLWVLVVCGDEVIESDGVSVDAVQVSDQLG